MSLEGFLVLITCSTERASEIEICILDLGRRILEIEPSLIGMCRMV